MLATPTTAGPVANSVGRPPTESATVLCAGQKRSGTHRTTSSSTHSYLPVIGDGAPPAQPPQGRLGGVVSAQPVDSGPGRRRLRTQIDPPHARRIRIHGNPWAEDGLQPIVGAPKDVAADVVGVVGLQLGGART